MKLHKLPLQTSIFTLVTRVEFGDGEGGHKEEGGGGTLFGHGHTEKL